MIPESAMLIVGDDDNAIVPVRSVANVIDQFFEMPLANHHVRIAGMFVQFSDRLDKSNGRKCAGFRLRDKIVAHLLDVRLLRRSIRIIFEIFEWLMMILEQAVGMSRERIVPSAAVPCPVDIFFRKLVADIGNC